MYLSRHIKNVNTLFYKPQPQPHSRQDLTLLSKPAEFTSSPPSGQIIIPNPEHRQKEKINNIIQS